ncbi:Cell wall protein phiA [Fulvia fulva]|nr:Cell wall protein phiA [Fulvia fulva]WPV17947.1 Cell wall protein phiA [Fulvia fulva]
MHTSMLGLAALASTLVAASPMDPIDVVWKAPKVGDKFGIAATGEGINKGLTATMGGIFVGGKQSPSCDRGARQDFANFWLKEDTSISLYKTDNPPQDLWVDASDMGGGLVGYTTGVFEQLPKSAARTGFAVDPDTRVLTFNGVGGKACPTGEDQKWTLSFTDSERPRNQHGCVTVELKAFVRDTAVSCWYSDSS